MELAQGGGGESLEPQSKGEKAGRRKRGRNPDQRSRTPLEKKRDARLIADWKLSEHLDNETIADRLTDMYRRERKEGEKLVTVSRQTVDRVVIALEDELIKDAGRDIATLRALKIANLIGIAVQARRDYEASKRPRVKRTVEKRNSTGEKASDTRGGRFTTEHRVGNDRLLRIALDAEKEVAELQALYPPKKIAPTSPDGTKPFEGFQMPEEFKRLAAILAAQGEEKS